ncbi:hypothetical protein NBRC116586_08350 [Pseudooceanicola nitratireducens]|uniref:DUF3987 domain-containing protein n=1 Tax=Pseudooceanicola nitratireducens TaxID=517719 RepID=UPI00310655FA
MTLAQPIPFNPRWPDPDPRYLSEIQSPPPPLHIESVLSPEWTHWIKGAAEATSAPPDYIFMALLTVAGSLLGNTRWAAPWVDWEEPPILWTALIGTPSMNKSPALNAIISPLRSAERTRRTEAQKCHEAWRQEADKAKIIEAAWKDAVKAATKEGSEAPARPKAADIGPEPVLPRLAMSDATIEKVTAILAQQPRGVLVVRDELAGWVQSMSRYTSGGDRQFWIETYGGRSYSVERMGRSPIDIARLSASVIGNIQPDRLRTQFLNSQDDGFVARVLPIWPERAPLTRPSADHRTNLLPTAIDRLLSLQMVRDAQGHYEPKRLPFTPQAMKLLEEFRHKVRAWEDRSEGIMVSFTGKLHGLSVRLSLILTFLEWVVSDRSEPETISAEVFATASNLIETYLLPMAQRAYAPAAYSGKERAGRKLMALLHTRRATAISTREIQRAGRSGLQSKEEVDRAISALVEADILRSSEAPPSSRGGRPARKYSVNPAIFTADCAPEQADIS